MAFTITNTKFCAFVTDENGRCILQTRGPIIAKHYIREKFGADCTFVVVAA